jgi:multidrug efflux pump subunit AcrA (membrane-fusion protein)
VPQQAIAVRDGFSYVFRLNPDSRVSQLKVTTGRRLGERIEVVSGWRRHADRDPAAPAS